MRGILSLSLGWCNNERQRSFSGSGLAPYCNGKISYKGCLYTGNGANQGLDRTFRSGNIAGFKNMTVGGLFCQKTTQSS